MKYYHICMIIHYCFEMVSATKEFKTQTSKQTDNSIDMLKMSNAFKIYFLGNLRFF